MLWDEEDKRGWLVNGTSVLLHLLRASLKHDSMDEISTEFLFNPESMQEAPETHKASSAIKVLVTSHNRKLPIYLEKEGYLRLEDRIEELYDTLEKIMDYEVSIATQISVNSSRTRKHLEGWDLMTWLPVATSFILVLPLLQQSAKDGSISLELSTQLHYLVDDLVKLYSPSVLAPVPNGQNCQRACTTSPPLFRTSKKSWTWMVTQRQAR